MTEVTKNAYRYLLHVAMLDIRSHCWQRLMTWRIIKPGYITLVAKQIQYAADIADWMENLADFAAHDFHNFDETRFWREADDIVRHHQLKPPGHFRWYFDRFIRENSPIEVHGPSS